jgi:hypothetical protein
VQAYAFAVGYKGRAADSLIGFDCTASAFKHAWALPALLPVQALQCRAVQVCKAAFFFSCRSLVWLLQTAAGEYGVLASRERSGRRPGRQSYLFRDVNAQCSLLTATSRDDP